MAKHIQTIRRQIADELFECVWPLCIFALKGLTIGTISGELMNIFIVVLLVKI